ncbi:MAG: hypothetical protein QM632_00440 [Micrococcaceae bacterium]
MDERPHKPAKFDPQVFENYGSGVDPAEMTAAASRAAHALLHHGRDSEDDAITERLVTLTDDYGLSLLSELWALSHPRTLPGALWRIYTLRAVINKEPDRVSTYFQTGRSQAEVSHAIAGVAEPASADEIVTMADAILTGAFDGDFAIALERFGSFCRVVAVGQTTIADHRAYLEGIDASHLHQASQRLVRTAEDLEYCAQLWRAGELR